MSSIMVKAETPIDVPSGSEEEETGRDVPSGSEEEETGHVERSPHEENSQCGGVEEEKEVVKKRKYQKPLELSEDEQQVLESIPKTPGVTWDGSLKRWMAHMPPGYEGVRSRCFAVSKYGVLGAWEEAYQCRVEAQACVEEVDLVDISASRMESAEQLKEALKALPIRPKGLTFDRSGQRWLCKYLDPTTQTHKYKSFCLKKHGAFNKCFVKAMVFHNRVQAEHRKVDLIAQVHQAAPELGRESSGMDVGDSRHSGMDGRRLEGSEKTLKVRTPQQTRKARTSKDTNQRFSEYNNFMMDQLGWRNNPTEPGSNRVKDELGATFNRNSVKAEDDSDCEEISEQFVGMGQSYFED
eukprot:GHVS01047036.1.p1 GENE.GHVS01047036.1~~GHVS01047036.1.p1  ORF type:complete len:353 (-),score=63.89 GHVS01047036.1:46-1104(-)